MQSYKNYSFTARSDIGSRNEQQDHYAYIFDNDSFLAVVCDGMGGLEAGGLASKVAVKKLIELFDYKDANESFQDFFYNNIDILDECVFNLKSSQSREKLGCGTTIVAVGIEKDILYWLLVGDSRLYFIRNGEIEQSNKDHNYSLILEQMDLSLLSEEQIELERKKADALISYVGMGGIKFFSTNSGFKIIDNDVFLLTTDGLFKVLSDEEIKQIVMSHDDIDETADALMCAVGRTKSRDNTTFILIKAGGNRYEENQMQ